MCLGSIGRIVDTWDEGGIPMARVDTEPAELVACLMYVPEAIVGDDVLVHIGYAVEVLAPEVAVDARALRAGVQT